MDPWMIMMNMVKINVIFCLLLVLIPIPIGMANHPVEYLNIPLLCLPHPVVDNPTSLYTIDFVYVLIIGYMMTFLTVLNHVFFTAIFVDEKIFCLPDY